MTESVTIEPYGGVAEIAFWPLIVFLIFVAWRMRANKTAALCCVISALVILIMGSIYIIVFGPTSLAVLHDFDVALAVLGIGLLIVSAALIQEITIGKWKKDRAIGLVGIVMGLFGLPMLVYGVVSPIQDLFLPRYIVEGDVSLLETRGRRPRTNFVHIGDARVQASPQLYRGLRLRQHVRAEVSSGSDYIRRIERIPAPSTK